MPRRSRCHRILRRGSKNNQVQIVESGVGKTAVVSGLPQRNDKEDVPSNLQRRVVAVDMCALVAVVKYRGQSEAVMERSRRRRCRPSCSSTRSAFSSAPGATGDGAMDAVNLLKPMLSRGELRCIGTMTLDEYRKYVEMDPAFERRFQRALTRSRRMKARCTSCGHPGAVRDALRAGEDGRCARCCCVAVDV